VGRRGGIGPGWAAVGRKEGRGVLGRVGQKQNWAAAGKRGKDGPRADLGLEG
jgi:hypothetical protein